MVQSGMCRVYIYIYIIYTRAHKPVVNALFI